MAVGIASLKTIFRWPCLLFLVFAPAFAVKAQICTGSLGDPVVNINFGYGSGGNTGYTPTNAYTLVSSNCPNDGQYTITNSTSGCFSNAWHTVARDHTGSGGFMLVNASFTAGDFFVATVGNLCPNTTYEFAAWIMNVLNKPGIRPNITFSIETPAGTILQDFSTGDIPESISPDWKQYGFFFKTPSDNPNIVLRMRNNAPGGNGNDLALDDITFRPCGEKVIADIIGSSDTINICEDKTASYNFSGSAASSYVSPVFHWQVSRDSGANWEDIPGATSTSYTWASGLPVGSYWYRLSVSQSSVQGLKACRVSSENLVINVQARPKTDAGPDRVSYLGKPVSLLAVPTDSHDQYLWKPPDFLDDATLVNPKANPPADKIYILTVRTPFQCERSDSVRVTIVAGIFVPTAFTPNGDGLNDYWRVPSIDPLLEAEATIYNRWGKIVYRVKQQAISWDGTYRGTPQPAGLYTWYIRFNTKDFEPMKGVLTLIR